MYVCTHFLSLSTQTPPGTKVQLLHKVEVERGFLLLGKNSLRILGGNVEHLIQKWSLTKVSYSQSVGKCK